MSTSRKLLKIVSLVSMLSGISYLVFGVIMGAMSAFGGGSDADAAGGAAAGTALLVVAVVATVVYLGLGFLGLRAANVPSKIGSVYALSLVGLAVAVVNVVLVAWQGFGNTEVSTIVNLVIGLAESIAIFVLSRNIKKERELWH